MEIYHHISLNSRLDKLFLDFVERNGIEHKDLLLPGGKSSLVSFDMAESDQRWPRVSEQVMLSGAVDISETSFTQEEILASAWLRLIPVNTIGYPQPEKTWSRDHPDYADYCHECGTHRQENELRLKANLQVKNVDFATLYWTYALLCADVICDECAVAEFVGFECWRVLVDETNEPSELRQIVIPHIGAPSLLDGESLAPQKCPVCGQVKFSPHTKGIMKLRRDALGEDHDFVRTFEWFGSGRSAYREILVSNRVARLIVERGWQGVRLKAIDLM